MHLNGFDCTSVLGIGKYIFKMFFVCAQYDDQLNDIVSSIENDICSTPQSSTSYLVSHFTLVVNRIRYRNCWLSMRAPKLRHVMHFSDRETLLPV